MTPANTYSVLITISAVLSAITTIISFTLHNTFMSWVLLLSTFYRCEKGGWGILWLAQGHTLGGSGGAAGFDQRRIFCGWWGRCMLGAGIKAPKLPFTLNCSRGQTSPCSQHPDPSSLTALTTVIHEGLFVYCLSPLLNHKLLEGRDYAYWGHCWISRSQQWLKLSTYKNLLSK